MASNCGDVFSNTLSTLPSVEAQALVVKAHVVVLTDLPLVTHCASGVLGMCL